MHGRTPLVFLLVIAACLLPAGASAAPMPAGQYQIELTDGSLDLGDGVLPPLTLGSGTVFTTQIGADPIAQPIGLTVESIPVSVGNPGDFVTGSGTLNVTITGAGITVDPATGNATIDASFYATVVLSGKIVGISVSGTCAIGSAQSPVVVHLDSANGSAWDPATGAFSMVDNTFAITRSCGSLEDIVALLFGNTGVGDNTAILNGIATRRPDAPPATTTPPPTGTTFQPPATTAPTNGSPSEGTPLVNAPAVVKSCVVPKLVGKTLKQAKRALKKAGCKVGKAKKSKSKKKRGRIVKQRYKVGTKLPAGAKVPLTVSKGPKKARKHRSR